MRGQPVFVLSGLLQELEKHLRQAAGAGAWQVGGSAVKYTVCALFEYF